MPHSVAAEPRSSPGAVKDEPMEEDSGIPGTVGPAADADQDVDMDGATAQDDADATPEAGKQGVKLEELFVDVDSDDEFPSSAPVKEQASSPPAGPASPTYVMRPRLPERSHIADKSARIVMPRRQRPRTPRSCEASTSDSSPGDSSSSG